MTDDIQTPATDNSGEDQTQDIVPATDQETDPAGDAVQVDVAAGQKETPASDTEGDRDIKPDWPEDWRAKLAGDDEKFLKRLGRFQSPLDVVKSWRALEQKLSSGDVKATLPADATDEQVAAYRKENGIPDKPEGYLENLPNGLVIGDDDKELVSSYLERVHGKNASPEVVSEALDWYYSQQEMMAEKISETDNAFKQESDDLLRAEWGSEYKSNLNSMRAFMDMAPADQNGTPLKELLFGARLADGTMLGDNPAALKWLTQMAKDANPAGFIAPGSGMTQIDGVKEEIAAIEKVMRTDRRAYDGDEKMQARLRELYSAEEKLGA